MFDAHDVVPQQLGWGARVWATVEDYDEDLASFLGELACGDNATVDMAHGLARRVLQEQEASWWLDAAERVYARRLAARLSGDDCAPAEGLPEEVQKRLQELAAR